MTEVTIDSDKFKNVPRILIEADLKAIQGDRFQPTGFPDLGAAVYEKPDGKRMILVESAQSIANRLEATILDESGIEIAKDFEGLPYIRANLEGKVDKDKYSAKTTSLLEAHRLNSPHIIGGKVLSEKSEEENKKFRELFEDKAGYKNNSPLNWKNIAAAFLFYDPNSLLHGSFLNVIDGRFRISRSLSGFIEAENIKEVVSGGVKNDLIDPKGKIQIKNPTDDEKKKCVYGNVPYHRMEYTAERIVAYFNFDVSLLEGYGLPKEAKELLIALGLYKIRRLLNNGLRLRTACDFIVKDDIRVVSPGDFVIPSESELIEIIKNRIKECKSSGLFADPAVTELSTEVIKKDNDSDKKSESS